MFSPTELLPVTIFLLLDLEVFGVTVDITVIVTVIIIGSLGTHFGVQFWIHDCRVCILRFCLIYGIVC